MTQPSASELLKTGRLAKEKLPLLISFFDDVVGPDHFGLPFTKFEAEFLRHLRRLPASAQQQLLDRVRAAAEQIEEATSGLDFRPDFTAPGAAIEVKPPSRKRSGTHG